MELTIVSVCKSIFSLFVAPPQPPHSFNLTIVAINVHNQLMKQVETEMGDQHRLTRRALYDMGIQVEELEKAEQGVMTRARDGNLLVLSTTHIFNKG